MLSIAVVTKRPGLALTLTSRAHQLAEIKPVEDWQSRRWDEQVIVLDLDDPKRALGAVESLRGQGVLSPLLVVAGSGSGWSEVADLYPDVILLPLPLSASAVQSAITRAAELAKSNAFEQAAPSAPTRTFTRKVASPRADPGSSPAIPVAATAAPTPTLDTPARARPAPPQDETAVHETNSSSIADLMHGADGQGVDDVGQPATRGRHLAPRGAALAFVRDLRQVSATLPRVADIANLVCEQARRVTAAEAAAVLLQDATSWRVMAGTGLRPLEHRLQLEASHWLVTEVVRSEHGLLIENTDIARSRLSGAPLASWPNLLAAPIASVSGLVLVASLSRSFTREDLARVMEHVASVEQDLVEAMEVRDLARSLLEFVDLGE